MNSDIAYQGMGGAVFAMVGIWSVVGLGLYVWYLWALSRLFPYLGLPKAHGWIPIWNQWRLIERGGMPGWMVLLGIVPFLGIVVLVVSIIAIHRINSEHREGAGMTVLGAFIPPLWATLLGSRLRDRGQGAQPAGTGAPGTQGQFAGRGLVEYGPNGEVYPLLNTNAGRVPQPPQLPQAPLPTQAQASAAPNFAMPPVLNDALAQNAAQTAMPPAPSTQPQPQQPQQRQGTPVTPPADPQWSLGKTVDSNFERLANEENPSLERLFSNNENARPFSWPEPQPYTQVPPAPAAPPAPQSTAAPAVQLPPAPPQSTSAPESAPTPTFMPPVPPAQQQAPPAQAAPAAPATPQGPPTAPTYAPPVQPAATPSAPAPSAPAPSEAAPEVPLEDELDRTVVVSRRSAWVLELPDGSELDLVGDDIVLGRKPTSVDGSDVLHVPDATRTLSKSHARLRRTGEVWTIEDLNSTNGVFVFDEAGVQVEVDPGIEREASEHLIIGTLEVRLRPSV